MATASTKERELQLLDTVELKILNVANKEQKLHELLQRYLPPVILKAASEHAQVRAKVVQIFSKLKTFIQPPEVILPVGALLDQYKSSDSPLVKQLDISGIQHSIERLDDYERRQLIPKALSGFAKDQGVARAGPFFNIILRLLLDARIPPRGSKDDTDYREAIGLSDEADAKFLASMISIFLRLRNPTQTQNWTTANPTLTKSELESLAVESPESQKVFERMSELKLKLVALLASGAFTDEEKFLPALYAASSFDNRLVSAAEEVLKRSSVSMEDEALVKRLFHAHSILPPTYRTRILNMLSKSSISATMSDDIMAVVKLNFSTQDQASSGLAQNLLPKSALEQTKLHTATFQYLAWVARVGPSQEGFDIAVPLVHELSVFIEGQGWPVPQRTSHDDIALRSKAYETIGVLARSANMPIARRLQLAGWLFKSLSEDTTADAVVNIDGALSSLTTNIPAMTGSESQELKTMLLTFMSLADEPPAVRSTRHAVVKWANQCLAFSDVLARWIDILAVGAYEGERSDVIEQGHKGLDPWTYHAHAENSLELPDWKEMIIMFFGSEIIPESITEAATTPLPDVTEKSHSVFENFQGSRIAAFPVALRYCKHIMFLKALEDFEVEPDWMQTLDARVKTDIKTREKILAYLHTIDSGFIIFYLKACLDGAYLKDSPITEECIRCFVDVASLSPGGALGFLTEFSDGLFQLIKSNNKEIRSLTARALGILVSHLANDPSVIDNCLKLVGPELNAAEGGLLAYSYVCSRSVYYGQPIPDDVHYPIQFITGENVVSSLHDTALEAFAQLWTAGLAIPEREGDHSLEKVISKLVASAKKGNEKAILALGRLAAGLSESGEAANESEDGWSHGILGNILKELFALHEIKQVEVQFTVGDAITATLARWESDYVKLTLDVESRGCLQKRNGSRGPLLTAVLNKIFADCKATKPSLLKASGIWLFCIVQYCSHLEEVQSRLRETQAAFMRLLSARDELVQETASRGLSLVYERGDSDLKSALVKDLVSAFTGNSTQLKVDQETELFEPGALPTGEGSSITSYKDIVNLANEVGDQRLVYKFMSLAANAATWSTRSAFGRFGLSNILSESEVDPKLYPKLYRYRFDPNQNVQRSMDDIWKALVKDSGAILSTHFDAILDDLLKSILGREWRMREASCAAISELIQGQPFNKYEKRYRDIWTSALKVLDDVKGSVREAAFKLCRTLSNTLVRQLEEGTSGSAAQSMMKEALPFLLSDKGIESSVKEVQAFAAITVIELTKKGGKALRPFIPEMVPQLLGLLSSIEPEQINWHYQRAGEDSRDQIDKIRSQMVNRSPISEAIDNSLRFVDADVMAELAPKLEATIKTAIGMPTKIGCSRVLTTLFTRHTNDIKGVSNKFLQLMEKQTMDKNDEVSQAYARATAYMLRAASDSAKNRFCKKFIDMYFEAEEESRRQKTADVIVALAKISPDHFTALETQLLPFSYLGSHDTDEYTSKVFKEVWEQHAGSSRTVVRYVLEIVALVERCLDTAQWALRHGGAFTVAAMVSDVASASDVSGQISDANLNKIWPVFEKTLALKTFAGKEKLLESYPKFVEKGHSLWKSDSKIAAQMKKIALREAKRNNDEYRVHAFRCLWEFAKARDDLDMLDEIAEIVTPYLEELKGDDETENGDKMDIDSKDQVAKEQLAEKTASNGLEAVARGHSHTDLAILTKIINILKPFLSSPNFATIKRQIWYECVRDLMNDATLSSTSDENAVALTYLLSLDVDLVDTGTEPQRIMRAKAVGALFKAKGKGVFGPTGGPDAAQLKTMVSKALEAERSLEVQRVLRDILVEME
ncbi:Proteasome-associated protein ECM29 like protein [Fusarium oxysporum f. sp. cubense race 1]|uniref:Proteasome-associated protein ECM29 like protein n=1 Tax=Fusarium oxysporum f. sp. cubense (strain race 1) TaxID=1229664 RepID=N4TKM6_FUSC1|nr:Proteasome-associated protein ECM29 like protein [Fusarium oxysporum f. sp. cubense race 1]